MKGIASSTSNHDPDQIILSVTRKQATEKLNAYSASKVTESKIWKAAKTLDIQRTTKITFEIIEEYPNEYQSHLERIADFLLYQQTATSRPKFWKETNEGVMFNDNYKDNYSLKPTSSYFRSISLSDKLSFVAHCWTNWSKFRNNYIPAFKIKTGENDGTLKTFQLSTLEHFIKWKTISSKNESSVKRDQSHSQFY